jgi:hypothetical protein
MEVDMLKNRILGCACAIAIAGGLMPAKAAAQTVDKRTYFTFSGPVEIPGAALPAGKYVFRIADPETSRTVVQVASADGKRVYGMFFSRAAERQTAANDAEVRFMESPRGVPPAIRTWWYPGERTGREFVYPKQQARRIAERAHEPVLTTVKESTTTKETDTTELTRIAPGGGDTQAGGENSAAEANPSGLAQKGERAPSSIQTPVATVAKARTRLPQTASASPLVALIGVWMIAGATVVRFRRGRNA